MAAHRIDETDIVDVLLGQASSEVQERVQGARRSKTSFADLYEEWDVLLRVASDERAQIEIIRENTHRWVMERLEVHPSFQAISAQDDSRMSHPQKEGWPQYLAESKFSWGLGGIAVLAVGLFVVFVLPGIGPLNEGTVPSDGRVDVSFESVEAKYVQFGYPSGEAPGTESEPFGTVRDGVYFTPPGGVVRIAGGRYAETLRIAKALTLTSSGGTVRIGPQQLDRSNQ